MNEENEIKIQNFGLQVNYERTPPYVMFLDNFFQKIFNNFSTEHVTKNLFLTIIFCCVKSTLC